MSPPWNDPDRRPPPPDWNADQDGELESLARLYREHPPGDPPWGPTLARIQARLAEKPPRRRLGLLAGFVAVAAAAALGGLLLARGLWEQKPADPEVAIVRQDAPLAEDEEPYPVALLSEVHIIRMHPNDADRIVMGQPLLGSFDLAAPEDIEIEPVPEEGRPPRLRRSKGVPMIIVARTADEDDDEP